MRALFSVSLISSTVCSHLGNLQAALQQSPGRQLTRGYALSAVGWHGAVDWHPRRASATQPNPCHIRSAQTARHANAGQASTYSNGMTRRGGAPIEALVALAELKRQAVQVPLVLLDCRNRDALLRILHKDLHTRRTRQLRYSETDLLYVLTV